MEDTNVLKIQGGVPLSGEVEVHGAKNACFLPLVASLLTDQECILKNLSYVVDTELMMGVLSSLGVEVENDRDNRTVRVRAREVHGMDDKKFQEVVGKSRVPILLCGPLLSRMSQALIPALGGCVIGDRPVDFHVAALRKLGAEVREESDGIYFKADKLVGAPIRLDYPSVGATEQVLLSAVFAQGTTKLSNAAIEPEIQDLVEVLNEMGSDISLNERTYTIKGVEHLAGFEHIVIPDRLEAASWACAALGTNGNILVRGANPEHMRAFLEKYREVGGEFAIKDNGISFWKGEEKLRATNIETDVYPGFATDWQQPFTVLLTQSLGESIVHETVYESRFGYIETLNKMGADITLLRECKGPPCRFRNKYLHTAIIHGPTKLHGKKIQVPDLRAGFSYIVGALVAEGTTEVSNVKLLKRGYEDFINKLTSLGARVEL